MPTSSVVGRVAAVLALLGAIVVVLFLVLGGGSSYTVTAQFENASQLVTGNNVNVAGVPVGSIKEISLADDGQALVKMEISDSAYTPLPEGTHATIRSPVALGDRQPLRRPRTFPPSPTGRRSPPAGRSSQADTTSEVDLDQIFNTLDKPTVDHLKQVIQGFARAYDGVGAKANRGFYYLNPFLSTSRRVFGELNSDQANLEGLVVDAAGLTSTLDAKSPEISSLVANLNGMLGTIGEQQAVARLRGRPAAGLHAAVQHHRGQPARRPRRRPAARQRHPPGRPQAPALRQAAPRLRPRRGPHRQGPERRSSRRPGAANDLIELTRLQDPLAEIGVGPVNRNGASRPGALPASADCAA